MKYFIIQTNPDLINGPRIIGWENKIHCQFISREEIYKIPKRMIIPINTTDNTLFPDFLTSPSLLLSELVMEVIKVYGVNILSKEVILVDSINRKVKRYFLVILDEIIGSLLVPDNPKLKEILICGNKREIENQNLFILKNQDSYQIIGNLDFVESILRRGALGITLREVIME